jgi:CBS domain-containing protein
MYGTAWKEDRTQALALEAIAVGFRAFDTANQRKHYVEEGVGAAVRAAITSGIVKREDLFLQTKSGWSPSRRAPSKTASGGSAPLQEAAVLISDVLRTKGGNVVRIRTTDSVELAVRKLAEHRIGALVVEDRWMKPVGIFSERDFINAMARDGAAVLEFQVHQLMSTPMRTCRSSDRVDAVLATMTITRIRHLPVIENNELKGIVSIGDLVKHRLDEKELEASVLLDISRIHA